MSLTGFNRAAMPATTQVSSASNPTERKKVARSMEGVRGVKSSPL